MAIRVRKEDREKAKERRLARSIKASQYLESVSRDTEITAKKEMYNNHKRRYLL